MDELRQKQVLNWLSALQDKNKTVMEIKLESKQQEIEEKNEPKPVH